jgi:hypothetical protein
LFPRPSAAAVASSAEKLRSIPRETSCPLTLTDIREPTLTIACERCGRHGRYNVKRLIAVHGADAKLTELLVTLANCDKARSFSVYDRYKARFEGFRDGSLRFRLRVI